MAKKKCETDFKKTECHSKEMENDHKDATKRCRMGRRTATWQQTNAEWLPRDADDHKNVQNNYKET